MKWNNKLLSLRASLHSSCVLARVTSCNCLRARLKLSTSSVCMLTSLLEWEEMTGTDSGKGGINDAPLLTPLVRPKDA